MKAWLVVLGFVACCVAFSPYEVVLCLVFFRALRCEVEELEEAEKEKEGFYRARTGEMKDFKEATNRFVVDCQIRIEELRDELNEVKEKPLHFESAN